MMNRCSICGNDPVLEHDTQTDDPTKPLRWYVLCSNFSCQTETVYCASVKEAITAWNRMQIGRGGAQSELADYAATVQRLRARVAELEAALRDVITQAECGIEAADYEDGQRFRFRDIIAAAKAALRKDEK